MTWKFCGPSIASKAREWTEYRKRQQQPYNLYVKRRRWRNPPPTPELMEEAGSNHSFDLPPPEAPEEQEEAEGNKDFVLEQASTVPPPAATEGPTGLPSTPSLPSHPVLPLDEQEMQEHRDAILQQQMLGRQLLSELTRRHHSTHHLQEHH